MTEQVIIGKFAVTPPLLWDDIEDGNEYAVIDTTDAGDWCVRMQKIDKSNRYFFVLAQSARVFDNTVEASEFIHALEALGGKK
ncbi:hypothetical protein [[Haemophilus] ducreyi]|uniref:hypothetical protein n=1 Tax=Haemophilus ducreyi TaxID=730 RepID=UPI000655142A|nr:hypothetical protein [[Haemophilus] ducreyi]AKO46053.1 hypothetical protein RZ66_07650 [[Haemophilus] ducreyi]AKO47409.1 hypothetical protein RZ67_07415 [[Haemophilus] ducreyi]AKO48776.1 hypothetical protein RZ68_07495 [[Haemophilus] ducreyi]AKO49168.1 hypothetical protein RZ69_01775 [[Haemophilus] ducreyi]ANF61640.1 hypothetical protein A6037_02210 [[Haemophilus] ducreyi]